jgi:hypothetical protein
MNCRLSISFLLPLVYLAGCKVVGTPTTQTTASSSSSIAGNWQIQSGTAITSPPTAPYLVGALEGSDSALTGTFTTTQSSTVSPTVESYSGTYDASTGSLSLDFRDLSTSEEITAELSVPTDPTTLSTGTLHILCIPCTNTGISTSVVGVEVAPLNGTYTGTLSGTLNTYTLSNPTQSTPTPVTGTASVTLTQSNTPNSSGQFPLHGILTISSISGLDTFTISEISGASWLNGTVSGVSFTIASSPPCSGSFDGICTIIGGYIPVSFTASTNPSATQITISNLNFSNVGVEATNITLSGTLTLQ